MENRWGALIIIAACVLVLLIGSLKNKAELALNFVLRAVLGTAAIYMVNTVMVQQGILAAVGIGPLSVLTTGILGFPGVALLYGINFYFLL